ncbi:MAG: PEP/pyruvate-binding domain-containing protein [Verrucomicrobiia bacterium]
MNYLLFFTDPLAASVQYSGGKGANLALLTQRGFSVPPGFVIRAQAYRDFVNQDRNLLTQINDFSFYNAQQLKEESERFRGALAKLSLPKRLVDEVREGLGAFPNDQAFSIRSSSTMEDLASAAFAGQHDTYLNVTGLEPILDRIKSCFISLWHDRAIAYRQQHNFDHLLASMSVVVQQMIPCEVAGVGFSINPVSGDLQEIVVDANFGLGESVVSGESGVDHFEISKLDGVVRRSLIAKKTTQIIGVAGGTKEIHLSESEAKKPCLNEAQLIELTELLKQVERSYRFPQDIEWGFVRGKLYLLQSRPITTIPARWTRDESAERFPNVITPLTWDFVESGFHRSLSFSFNLMGFPPCHGKWFGMHGHYIYGNQNVVELYLKHPPFTVSSLEELKAIAPKLREEFRWVQELPVIWSRELDYYLLKIGEFMVEPLANKSTWELWNFILSVNEQGADYFQPNIAISITHATLHHLLYRLIQMVAGADSNRLFDGLMAYCETKTGIINRELFEMAQFIRTLPELEDLLKESDSQEVIEKKYLEKFPDFQRRFQKFLRDHGHREIDFDMYHPTWLEVPWVVLDNIRLILQTPLDQMPLQKERELKVNSQQMELELFRHVPQELHFFFYEILRLTRIYTSLDDLEHYQTTRLALPLRKGLRELGRRLVVQGILAEPMDIFFGHLKQINELVCCDNDLKRREFAEAIRQQKAAYLADKARKPEWILGENKAESIFSQTDCLTGLPGSSGQAEGMIFIVLSAEDFAKFPKGSILVARTTNPTWTPLFYSAKAVIAESGGPLSHGAVTAREMGIPAVMSVKQCLSRLKNGQRVRVDGSAGKIFLD